MYPLPGPPSRSPGDGSAARSPRQRSLEYSCGTCARGVTSLRGANRSAQPSARGRLSALPSSYCPEPLTSEVFMGAAVEQ
jgi:hypothetical protein